MTLERAMDRFEELLRRGGQQGRHAAVQFLSGYLQAQPDQAFAVLKHLKAGNLPPQAHTTLFLALEVTGTAQARRALVKAIDDEDLSTANRLRAIVALQDVPRLSTKAVDALLSMARSPTLRETRAGRALASASLLALGRVSQRLRGQRDDLVAQIRQELVLRLTDDTDQAGLVVALRAVENSGDSYLLGFVAEVLEQESATVRAQATRSLRRMEDPESNVLLSDQLASDEDAGVRSAAAETLVERAKLASRSADNGDFSALQPSSEVVSTAIDCLGFEDQRHVRLQLVTLLGIVGGTQVAARRALIEHFHRERDPTVLKRIGRYVSGREILGSSPTAAQ
jgi:HEAT repeat protein